MKCIPKCLLVIFLCIGFICCNNGNSGTFEDTVETPFFSINSGEVEDGTSLEISCDTDGASIFYTTDGSKPSNSSTEYTTPIILTKNVTVQAIAEKDGMNRSAIAKASYTVKTKTDGNNEDDGNKDSADKEPENKEPETESLDGIYVYTILFAEQPINFYTWVISGNNIKMYQCNASIDDNLEVKYTNYLNTTIKKEKLTFTIQKDSFKNFVYELKSDNTGTFLKAKDITGEISSDSGNMYKVSSNENTGVPQGFEDIYWNNELCFHYSEIMNENRLELRDKEGTFGCDPISFVINEQTLTVSGIKYLKKGGSIQYYSNASFTATFDDKSVTVSNVKNFPAEYNPAGTYSKYIRTTPWKSIDDKDIISSSGESPNKDAGNNPNQNDGSHTMSDLEQYLVSLLPSTTPYKLKLSGTIDFSELNNLLTNVDEGIFIQLELPYNLTIIPEDSFSSCECLTEVIIPDGVTTIEGFSFDDCGIEKLYIPASVTKIGDMAFFACNNLTKIIVDKNNPKYDSRNDCNAIIETRVNTLVTGCKSTIIPDSIVTIGLHAFCHINELENITIPASVTRICKLAFRGCSYMDFAKFEDEETWYVTTSETDWINMENGIKVDVSDTKKNVELLSRTYQNDHYWYKIGNNSSNGNQNNNPNVIPNKMEKIIGNSEIDDFYISNTELTYAKWYEVYQWAIKNGYIFQNLGREGHNGTDGESPKGEGQPVAFVSWRDAIIWCNAASQKENLQPVYYLDGTTDFSDVSRIVKIAENYDNWGSNTENTNVAAAGEGFADTCIRNINSNGYRLPTEAEWEYAAKGGKEYTYGASNDLDEVAWYGGNSGRTTHDVGTKKPNGYSLFDMCGNVLEWCWDAYDTTEPNRHVIRSAGYIDIEESMNISRRSCLNCCACGNSEGIGLRVARNVE